MFFFSFLNLGFPEIATILIVALLLLGPQKLPEFARWLGRLVHDLKRTTQEVRDAINFEIEKEEIERLRKEFAEQIQDPTADLKKAANTWMDDITNPPPASATTAPDALQALGILAPQTQITTKHRTDNSVVPTEEILPSHDPAASPMVESYEQKQASQPEVSRMDSRPSQELEPLVVSPTETPPPKLASIPLVVEDLTPPAETVARGRRIQTPFQDIDESPRLAETVTTEFVTPSEPDTPHDPLVSSEKGKQTV